VLKIVDFLWGKGAVAALDDENITLLFIYLLSLSKRFSQNAIKLSASSSQDFHKD
jgi:hypothetical protein